MDDRLFWQVTKDAVNEGLLICDAHLQILDVNRNLEIMLELDPCRGKSVIDVLPWKVKEVLNKVIKELESTGVCVIPRRINFVTSKGVILPLTLSGDLLIDEQGKRVGYIFVFRDAIVQEEISSFSWINYLKRSFLSDISKNMYLPLHNLSRLLGDFVEFYSADPEGMSLLESAIEEVDKLRATYDRLLEHARIDLICERINLKKIRVFDVLNKALMLLVAENVVNRVEITADGRDELITDEFKLEQFFVLILDVLLSFLPKQEKLNIGIYPGEGKVDVDLCWRGGDVVSIKDKIPFVKSHGQEEMELSWSVEGGLEKNLMQWIEKKLQLVVEVKEVEMDEKKIRISIPREL